MAAPFYYDTDGSYGSVMDPSRMPGYTEVQADADHLGMVVVVPSHTHTSAGRIYTLAYSLAMAGFSIVSTGRLET